jgi:hypothetical protein
MADDLTAAMAKFVRAVSEFSTHLGRCSAVYRSSGVTVAAWDVGNVTLQLADEDDIYFHYDEAEAAAALVRGKPPGISRELAAKLTEYASGEGIPAGSTAPPPN